MPRTVQIRDIDDEVYAALARGAADAGLTVPELLRREAARLTSRPSVEEWLERTRRRPSAVSRAEVIDALDEIRGEWPECSRSTNDSHTRPAFAARSRSRAPSAESARVDLGASRSTHE